MSEGLNFVTCAAFIGIGATLVMDLWAACLKRFLGIPPLNYAMVGRWIGHFPRGRFAHDNIASAVPVRGEGAVGWAAHYAIGVVFAALLLAIWGVGWAHHPTPLPAFMIGLGTLLFPFFLMQPGLGFGVAASKTPRPNIVRLLSLMAHTAFGVGLYCSAWIWARMVRP